MDKLEKLEMKQLNLREAMTEEGFKEWLESPYTKAFLLQFEIDLEDVNRQVWNFSAEQYEAIKCQVAYIEGIPLMAEEIY